jgi:hypothetical protein
MKETTSTEQGAALAEDTVKEGALSPQDLATDLEHPYQLPMVLLMYIHPPLKQQQ